MPICGVRTANLSLNVLQSTPRLKSLSFLRVPMKWVWAFLSVNRDEGDTMKKIHFFAMLLFISLVFIPNTYAHKVQMFAYPEGDTVFVEGYFADGKKPKKSEVMVYDTEGKVLFNGVTDDEGKLSFKIPRKTDLRITLNAGMGHKAEYTLPASELGGAGKGAGNNPPLPPFKKGGDKKAAIAEGASA